MSSTTIPHVKWSEMDGAIRQILRSVLRGERTVDSATTEILNSMKLLNNAPWATAKIDRPIKQPSEKHLNLFPRRPLVPRQYIWGQGGYSMSHHEPIIAEPVTFGDLKPLPKRANHLPVLPTKEAKPAVFSPDMATAING